MSSNLLESVPKLSQAIGKFGQVKVMGKQISWVRHRDIKWKSVLSSQIFTENVNYCSLSH